MLSIILGFKIPLLCSFTIFQNSLFASTLLVSFDFFIAELPPRFVFSLFVLDFNAFFSSSILLNLSLICLYHSIVSAESLIISSLLSYKSCSTFAKSSSNSSIKIEFSSFFFSISQTFSAISFNKSTTAFKILLSSFEKSNLEPSNKPIIYEAFSFKSIIFSFTFF